MPRQIAHYKVLHPIGEGGMGIVYAAEDERLGRKVALKLLTQADDDEARERFWREARVAASVNHPNICQIYDVGEHERHPFLAMELLSGEPLDARIKRGPIPLPEALSILRQMLTGLDVLHTAEIIHRDLKPSNVFLTDSGVKLLDFGLARPADAASSDLTRAGTILGTPRYMAPEQWASEATSAPTDLFAAAAILFEMLTAKPAFEGDNALALMRSIANDHPPALTGDSRIEAVDRVIHRALAKALEDRYPSASAMMAALDSVTTGRHSVSGSASGSEDRTAVLPAEVRAVTRLMVLPFRLLRPDEEIDFLSFSLADAVTASLSGMRSLVVRSAVAGGRFDVGGRPDLEALNAEGDVDAVLFGTLLRGGDRVRLATQLLRIPSGTVLATNTEEATLDDIFRLQDELAEKVTKSLAIPLGEREERAERQDVPADGRAYEHYLRANELAVGNADLTEARRLYQRSLEIDPDFAPAWARLGRVERLIAKYGGGDRELQKEKARVAFNRALEINPDLPLAHNLYTYFQVEEEADSVGAMERLLRQINTTPDPDLYAGLVVACRFCGLLDASVAAHHQARRLDPSIVTSVSYTYWMQGEYDRAIEADDDPVPFMQLFALTAAGRMEEAEAIGTEVARRAEPGNEWSLLLAHLGAARGEADMAIQQAEKVLASGFGDPEGLLFVARDMVLLGDMERALPVFERIVDGGFYCLHLLREDVLLSGAIDSRYQVLLARSELGASEARERFIAAGGERVLGIST